jgi:dienelactone hydrolase
MNAGVARTVLGLADPIDEPLSVRVEDETVADDHVRQLVTFSARDGDRVPAYLLLPQRTGPAPAVLLHHQHASQWHLGKSEVAGLVGDPLQAFGPALARSGVVVLAPDSVGFEDRRRHATGTRPDPDDLSQWGRQLTSRLVVGDTLARKVLADAEDALRVLRSHPAVDPGRIGVGGHSYGGNVTIFQAAVDERVDFAFVSGAAGTYREKLARDIGIDLMQVVPGVARALDVDDLLALVAPRPLFVLAGDDDRYAADVVPVIEATASAYANVGHPDAFRSAVYEGGHGLTHERHQAVVDWLLQVAHHRNRRGTTRS